MSTLTYDSFVTKLQTIFNSTTVFSADDYLNAYNAANVDTGFILPNSSDYQLKWLEKRAIRHLFFYKQIRSIENFDVPKAKLEQMYNHYAAIVDKMDTEFDDEKMGNPEAYGLSGGSQFGEVVSSGFLVDPLTGNDKTYEEENADGVLINGEDEYFNRGY